MGKEHAETTALKKKLHLSRNGPLIEAKSVSRIEERDIRK
jgi:hypothetical protein